MNEVYGARPGRAASFSVPADLFIQDDRHAALVERLLAEHRSIYIPPLPRPILLDRPIRLESGMRLRIHESTVIRLKEGCGGCMARNANVFSGTDGPIDAPERDHDILIEGGQWEGGLRAPCENDDHPAMQALGKRNILLGVLFFDYAERVTIRSAVIRAGGQYGVLLADCHDFLIEDIFFDRHLKDGVHVNGPASHGLIQNMRGKCGDDFVALNAWDWDTSAVSFGPIADVTIRHIACEHDEMRLLPGRKTYPDGRKLDCPIENCRFEDIEGAYNFKMYQQPNCHNLKRAHKDSSEIAGLIKNVVFSDIRLPALISEGMAEVHLDAMFEMGADCEDIAFENFSLGFPTGAFRERNMSLAVIGPKSSTWTRGYSDPAKWTELFDPDLICTAENIAFRSISFSDGLCAEEALLLREQRLTPNPDYPNTTPKGGTGYGIKKNITIE